MENFGMIMFLTVVLPIIVGIIFFVFLYKWLKKKRREEMDYMAKKIAEEQRKVK
jgi:uncharacterized membrane protein